MKIFANRVAAGRDLGAALARLGLRGKVVVLGLPRGGIPVACQVGAALRAHVDALVVRKLGAPFNPELALGAIAFGGVTVYNDDLLAELGLREADLAPVRARELEELQRRENVYRRNKPALDLVDATVIIVDDGMATGATMHAAVAATRALNPARIIVAVPTAATDAVGRIELLADQVVALETPEPYHGVGAWYSEFRQLTDAEVVAALAGSASAAAEPGAADAHAR